MTGVFTDVTAIYSGSAIRSETLRNAFNSLDTQLDLHLNSARPAGLVYAAPPGATGAYSGRLLNSAHVASALTAPPAIGWGTPHSARFTLMKAADINVDSAAGASRNIAFLSNGSLRWLFNVSNAAEAGANSGSDFVLSRWDDAGGFLQDSLTIRRRDGYMTINSTLAHSGTALGFAGRTPTAPQTGWSITNYVENKTFNVSNATTAQMRQIIASLLSALITHGLISGSVS